MTGEYYPTGWNWPSPWSWGDAWPFNTPITVGPPAPLEQPSWVMPLPQFPMLLPAFWSIGIFVNKDHWTLDEDRNDEFPECYP